MAVNFKYALIADRAAKEISGYYEETNLAEKNRQNLVSARIYRVLKEVEESQEEEKEKTTTRYFAVYYTASNKGKQYTGLIGIESEHYPSLKEINLKVKDFPKNYGLEELESLPTNIVEMNEVDYRNLFSLNEKEEEK